MATGHSNNATEEVIADEGNKQAVKLVYDTWTPRPHFIFVQYDRKSNATDAELQATFKLAGHFLLKEPKLDKNAILSFHCGKWYQQHTGDWHAHLCVPLPPYIDMAKVKIRSISNNKEWKGASTVEQGINNRLQRQLQNYANYKESCLKKGYPTHSPLERFELARLDENSTEFKLAWTSPTPRISVIALSPNTSSLASLYKFLTDIRAKAARELAQLDANYTNFGCHLCLYVSGKNDMTVTRRQADIFNRNGTIETSSNIVGYIQMDETQYAQLLPTAVRQQWLNAFGKIIHSVET